MINAKRFMEIARKWKKVDPLRRSISLLRSRDVQGSLECRKSIAQKGHFVAYTVDGKRFVFPLVYLSSSIFRELFRMSEDEFGLPGNGPITFPCDAIFMEYVVSMVKRRMPEKVGKALLISMATDRCLVPSVFATEKANQPLLLYCF